MDQNLVEPNDVLAQVNLTVAEGKRLIVGGIANDEKVKARLASGMVIITRGTTNTYIAERLAGLTAPHGSFMNGHIIPEGAPSIEVEKINEKPYRKWRPATSFSKGLISSTILKIRQRLI